MKLYGETTTFDEDKLSEDIETKRQVFTTQPDPPYSVGDLWVQGKSGEILVCNTQRSSGSYVSSDWSKASKYTDDSGLTDWIDGDYADAIEMIGEQIDAKAETYYQANDPSLVWSEETKPIHEGDLWYRTTDNTTWYYTGSSWTQQNIPNAVFDEIDGKARIFTTQPTPPYFVGDLWFNSATSDILTCMTAKISGQSFSESDWVKRNKYTDDSSLDAFRNGAYANFVTTTQNGIASAQETADSRITTFYQATQPTANTEGDLWIDTDDSNKLYRWNGSSWMSIRDADIQNALTAAGNAQATADGKIMTYAQASPPSGDLDEGDLWIETDNNNKLYRWNGSKWVAYSDSSSLNSWLTTTYATDKQSLTQQIDGKIQTYYQTERPDTGWSTSDKEKHIGDLWYNSTPSIQKYYRWSGSAWEELTATPPSDVITSIDKKATIFTGNATPSTPSESDLWFKSASDPILTWVGNEWVEYNKYTDDSSLDAFKNGTYAAFVTDTNNSLSSKITTYYQSAEPSAHNTGDLWIDTDDSNKLYRWNGSSWVSVRDEGIQAALGAASNAQATADGKIVTFAQASQPTATDRGDLWIDTDDDNKLYRWDGSSWVSMRDGTIAEAATKATAYISEVTDDGIFVHEEDAATSPSTGTGVWITDAISIIKNGLSMLWAGVENSIAKIRIGLANAGHVIISCSGMDVYKDASTKVAMFGESVQLGEDSTSHSLIDYHSLQLIDKEGNSYLHLSDLRDKDGYVTLVELFEGNGTKTIFFVQFSIEELVSAVDSSNPSNTCTVIDDMLSFNTAPANGATITVTYKTKEGAKGFTIGTRKASTTIGAYSASIGKDNQASFHYAYAEGLETISDGFATHAEGYKTKADSVCSHAEGERSEATGLNSHAEGYNTTASGRMSHAEGYGTVASGMHSHAQNSETIASSDYQTVIGCGNIEDPDNKYLFIIGNQKGLQNRSNALTVDWDGGLQCGNIKCGAVTGVNVAANTYKDYDVTFDSAFTENPIIVVSFMSASTSANMGYLTVSAHSISTEGFTVRIFNRDTSSRSPYVYWIATTSGMQ